MELIVVMCAILNANDCREHRETIPPDVPNVTIMHNCMAYSNTVMPRVMEMLPKRRVSRVSCKPLPKVEEREA